MPQQQVAKELLQDSNWINKVQAIMQENVIGLFEKFYQGAHNIMYSSGVTTMIILIIIWWLLDKLKNGYPTKEETFGAIKYTLSLCLIYSALSSFNAYNGILYILTIPENIITSIVSSIFKENDFGAIITESANRVQHLKDLMWEYGINENTSSINILGFEIKNPIDLLTSRIITFFKMTPFWIFYIVFFILLIGIVIVIFFSKFTAFLIMSTLPLVIPFLIFTRFRPYLWSWYKLYLSYAMIAPLSFIALNLAMNPITKLEIYQNFIEDLFIKQFEYLITGTITCITAIFLLKKIPNWINSVMGTQMENGAGGVTGGVVAGAVAGKTFLGGLAKKATGGSFIGGAMQSFGRATGGRAIEQISKAGINAGKNIGRDIGNTIKTFKGGYATP